MDRLRIKSVQAEIVNLGLTKPYAISYKTVDSVANVIVRIEAENGMTGYGAANPSKYVVNEENEDVMRQLTNENLEVFNGLDLLRFYEVIGIVQGRFTSVGARIALEIALHDLFTQYLGVPLVDFYGRKIDELPTSVTIGIMGVEETNEEAREFVAQGFKNLKVKLGESIESDLERIFKLKEVISSDIIVRIDANQGWTFDDTVKFHKETSNLDLELIEQPLGQKDIDGMRKLPDETKRLVAADESLCSPQDAMDLVQRPIASGIFNIKLMKSAGITTAKEIALIAEKSGIDLMWGCNDESTISITAALHTAFSCRNTKYIDLDGSLDLATDVVSGGFILKDGMMSISNAPGLGLQPE